MKDSFIYVGAATAALIFGAGAFWVMTAKHDPQPLSSKPILAKKTKVSTSVNTTLPDPATSLRLSDAEKQISALSGQMADIIEENRKLKNLLHDNSENKDTTPTISASEPSGLPQASDQYENTDIITENDEENGYLSKDWVAEQDRKQTEYIDNVAVAFYAQNIDENGWSSEVEQAALEAMNSDDTLADADEGSSQQQEQGSNPTMQASMSSFSCRSQLCEASIQAATLNDLIAFQSKMVDKLSTDLPSIVFDVPIETGGQYTMRAYLAKDGYDFPAPN